jgi:hypothetical protein
MKMASNPTSAKKQSISIASSNSNAQKSQKAKSVGACGVQKNNFLKFLGQMSHTKYYIYFLKNKS